MNLLIYLVEIPVVGLGLDVRHQLSPQALHFLIGVLANPLQFSVKFLELVLELELAHVVLEAMEVLFTTPGHGLHLKLIGLVVDGLHNFVESQLVNFCVQHLNEAGHVVGVRLFAKIIIHIRLIDFPMQGLSDRGFTGLVI